MSTRYLIVFLSVLLAALLMLAGGIYASSVWNVVFLGLALAAAGGIIAFSLRRQPPPLPEEAVASLAPEDVYLVIGPYVASWFITRNDESLLRYQRGRLWLAARDGNELMKHLSRFHLQDEKVKVTLFFPFLPDGHDTAALAISSLMSWTKVLRSIALPEPLPCVFALYGCCSQQRLAYDPDRAIWSGAEVAHYAEGSLDHAFTALLATLAKQNRGSDSALAQRYATLYVLRRWLAQTQLLTSLNALLNNSTVSLSRLLLADYGTGFIRHGAWARWLDEKYAILPSLANSRIELALPDLPEAAKPAPRKVPQPERGGCRVGLPLLLSLVIGGSMVAADLYEKHRAVAVDTVLARFQDVPDEDIARKYAVLDSYQKSLSHCDNSYLFQNWGFSRCRQLLSEIRPVLNKYAPWVIYTSASETSLFASGNFSLLPERTERLRPLITYIQNNPTIAFLIIGHSDNSGDAQQNLLLSEQRAREVRNWLMAQTHTPAERFVLKGVGDRFPLRSNSTPEGKEINRRVEIIPLHPASLNANE